MTFSNIDHSFENFKKLTIRDAQETALKAAFRPVQPFPSDELDDKHSHARLTRACDSYPFFDKIYFPADLYEDGYAEPNRMINFIAANDSIPGVTVVFGPRKHGKTVTAKKRLIWKLLTGREKITGCYAETLTKASNILKDIYTLIALNERILHDFKPEFDEANSDQLKLRVPPLPGTSIGHFAFCAAFSEGRSARGYTRLFGRPSFILGDDLETLESSFSEDAVRLRLEKISETLHSLTSNGTFFILANDFTTRSALHRLRIEHEEGILDKSYRIALFSAFAHVKTKLQKQGTLWMQRYPAFNEDQLRKLLKPRDEADWQASYQMNPIPPAGYFFRRDFYAEYPAIPRDARGVLYCDPNLSKKSKGDTTAIVALVYSCSTGLYYIQNAVCRSFSSADALIENLFALKTANIYAVAFDGNVAQESTWTQFIRSYARTRGIPLPPVHYKKYHVNELAKNTQLIYEENKLQFPLSFGKSPDGERFLAQLFGFTGIKGNKTDDAPDALICAFEFLHERSITRGPATPVRVIPDIYS